MRIFFVAAGVEDAADAVGGGVAAENFADIGVKVDRGAGAGQDVRAASDFDVAFHLDTIGGFFVDRVGSGDFFGGGGDDDIIFGF